MKRSAITLLESACVLVLQAGWERIATYVSLRKAGMDALNARFHNIIYTHGLTTRV